MQTHSKSRLARPLLRRGVSLIELLVVMAIIAILAAASLAMLARTGEAARTTETLTTIRELHSIMNGRYNELMENFTAQEQKRSRAVEWINISYNAVNDPTVSGFPSSVREAVIKADRYRGTFPQRVFDLYGPDGLPGGTDNSPLLNTWLTATTVWNNVPIDRTPGVHTLESESSELLYLALTVGVSSGAGQGVLDGINPRHIQDTDKDGFPEFVDGWGHPLRFYNAPTRLIRPAGWSATYTAPTPAQYAFAESLMAGIPPIPNGIPANPGFYSQAFNQDPLDPKGVIRTSGASGAFYTAFEAQYRTWDTSFKPLIMSCGPDEALGLGEPTAANLTRLAGYDMNNDGDTLDPPDIEAADAAADNLTNLQRVQ